ERIAPFLVGMCDRPVFRAVLRGVAIVPLLERVAANVLGGFLVERLSEGHRQSVAVNVPFDRHIQGLACVTDPLKTAILQRARLPTGAADHGEMAVARTERAAHRAGHKGPE